MGEALLFQTNDPALLAAADEAFERFPRLAGDATSPLVLRVFVHTSEPDPPRQEEQRPRPIYRTQGHLFYITAGAENTVVADLSQGYAFGFVSPGVAQNRFFVRYTFLEGITFAMLSTARQFMPLHAACVVKDKSLILLGKAGAGKSTLAFACARRGYRVLTEDGLLISTQASALRLWGTPYKLHLLPESKRFFPELAHEQPKRQLNGEYKLEVELETLFPGSTITNAAPGLVLFLERMTTPGATRIEPVPLVEALEQLDLVWPWSVGWTEEMERQLARLLEAKTYRVRMSDSPDEVVEALDALLAQEGPKC
jgi:hypothetical protein